MGVRMKNKKGFTLVELCISIVLILLIAVFVMPRLINLGDSSKEKLYNSKINLALSAAYRYGNDNVDKLSDSCTNITIGALINLDYLDGDDKNGYNFENPLTGESMNNMGICLTYKNNEIQVQIIE